MKNKKPIGAYIVLYIPWLISLLFMNAPVVSYLIAWLGSFFIFYITFSGKLKSLPTDRSIPEQLMRPIFLMQIIFVGFMSVTSIFYFLDALGYEDFKKTNTLYIINDERLILTAQCQRYYCLAHAALISGIFIFMKYPVKRKYRVDQKKVANLLFTIALITLGVSTFFLTIPSLWQLYFQYSSLSFIAGTLALAFAIPLKKTANTIICVFLYFFNFYEALVSGFKEPIIISVLVLGIFLYPIYKRTILLTFVPILLALFLLLPTYNRVFREQSWDSEVNGNQASKLAINAVLNSNNNESNWIFFAFRLSEIDMFTDFVRSTPAHIDFYGLKLLEQSVTVLVPRVFWPGKPSTEDLIMQRVYAADVVYSESNVSAKPAYVVDAYLSAGSFGIFIYLFAYGAIAQLISQKAEVLFGGYTLGTALIFSGLFQMFWRGLSFEFLVNSVFWSYISMLLIFRIMIITKVIHKI